MRKLISSAVAAAFVLATVLAAATPVLAGSAENIKYRVNALKANGAISGA